jgi:hypothetical protein
MFKQFYPAVALSVCFGGLSCSNSLHASADLLHAPHHTAESFERWVLASNVGIMFLCSCALECVDLPQRISCDPLDEGPKLSDFRG